MCLPIVEEDYHGGHGGHKEKWGRHHGHGKWNGFG